MFQSVRGQAGTYGTRVLRIAIYGVGGAGGYFGAQLVLAGEEVVFVARGAHLEVIRDSGLCITSSNGEMLVRPSLATDDPAEAGPVDVIILGVKAEQVSAAASALRPMLGPDTFVVPLQNGVEATTQLQEVLGDAHVVAGLCGTLSWVTAPGHIRSLGDANFIRFGEIDNQPSARTERLRDIFLRAAVKAEIPADIHRAIWEKFLFVVSVGGVAAVNDATIGKIRSGTASRRMLELCMQEICALAEARQVSMEQGVVAKTMTFVDSLPEDGTASMQRDLAAGKPSELEAWTGAVVRLGKAAGIDTPAHTFIYEKLLPMERQARAAANL